MYERILFHNRNRMIYLLIPIIAVVLDISALLLLYLSIKYNDPEKLEQIK